jgi:preprotein translocase subunit SecB
MTDKAANKGQQAQPEFSVELVYLNDFSFESTKPSYTYMKDWKPEANIDMDIKHTKAGDDRYDVVLRLTVKVEMGGKTVFLVECAQAGVFRLAGFDDAQRGEVLESHCPSILFPYARQNISDTIVKAGYPPLYLSPVDFHTYYHNKKQSDSKGK